MTLFKNYNLYKKYKISEYEFGVTTTQKNMLFNDVVYTRYVVDDLKHTGFSDEVEMFFEKWFDTDKGKWISKHGESLHYYRYLDYRSFHTNFKIMAYLSPEDYTFFMLKFST